MDSSRVVFYTWWFMTFILDLASPSTPVAHDKRAVFILVCPEMREGVLTQMAEHCLIKVKKLSRQYHKVWDR